LSKELYLWQKDYYNDKENANRGKIRMLLKDATIGQTCIVEKINLPFQLERRLEALGMTNKTAISVLNRKGKGILIIRLRGTRFALGYNITKNIEVRLA
jgi:ferrous iron transport protein A